LGNGLERPNVDNWRPGASCIEVNIHSVAMTCTTRQRMDAASAATQVPLTAICDLQNPMQHVATNKCFTTQAKGELLDCKQKTYSREFKGFSDTFVLALCLAYR
jgi:hypothetical protein